MSSHLCCLFLVALTIPVVVDFTVDSVQDIRWNDRAFETLALPCDYKSVLLAFAKAQYSATAQFDDVIEGKGIR